MPDQRPDFSQYVVHFTKGGPPFAARHHDVPKPVLKKSARERLFSILADKRILACEMPWTDQRAVCFTECTWHSLLHHANRYSRFGVGFKKEVLFAKGGAPAFYLPPHIFEAQKKHVPGGAAFCPQLYALATPFCPEYASEAYKKANWVDGKNLGQPKMAVDFSDEREWRVPGDLVFEYSEVAFVIVDRYEDMAAAPTQLKDLTGREKWLLMANHERIEKLWPMHLLP